MRNHSVEKPIFFFILHKLFIYQAKENRDSVVNYVYFMHGTWSSEPYPAL